MVAMITLVLWAGISITLLTLRPEALAEKESRLEATITDYRTASQQMEQTLRVVADVTRDVESVRAQVMSLVENTSSVTPASAAPQVQPQPEPPVDNDERSEAQPPTTPPLLAGDTAVREQIHRLEESLQRLRLAHVDAIRQTTDTTQSRIREAERHLARLGLDAGRLGMRRNPGQGGPFIPAPLNRSDDVGIGALVERVQQWNGMKAAMRRLPLSEPIHGDYDFNSGFGTRSDPLNLRTGIHEGIDLGAPTGTPIYATGDGVVTLAQSWDRYGLAVEIDHGQGIVTRYAHMSRLKVRVGQRVNRSTVIGLVGTTGRSTGPHLHYEVRVENIPRDPLKFISVGRDAGKIR